MDRIRALGLVLPMVGGAVNIWKAASASTYGTAANWTLGHVPLATEAVQIGSGTGATQSNCTLNVTTNSLGSLDFTGYTGTFTMTAAVTANVAGNVTLSGTMTYTSGGSATWSLSGTCAFTTAGKTISPAFRVTGGTTTHQDAFNGVIWVAEGGTITTNNQTITCNQAGMDVAGSTMNLGSSAITCNGNWLANTTGTLNTGTSTITFTGTAGAPTLNSNAAVNSTFFNVIFKTQTASQPSIAGNAATSFHNLTVDGTGLATKTGTFSISATVTVTNQLSLGGGSTQGVNRLLIQSSSMGTQRAFACSGATVVITGDTDFMDIAITGTPTWTNAGNAYIGDALGNSGQSFTTAAPQAWTNIAGGNWSAIGNWNNAALGASPTPRVPLPQDDVQLNQAFFGGAPIVTADMPRLGQSIDWTGTTGAPAWTISVQGIMYGSLTLAAGVGTITLTAALLMEGRSAFSITSNGKQIAGASALQLAGLGSTCTLQDDVVLTAGNFWAELGTIDANGHNVTASVITVGVGAFAATVKMGSGTWTATGIGNVWLVNGTNVTLQAGTSTIALTQASTIGATFTGGGLTYNNVSVTGGNRIVTFTGSNAFNALSFAAPMTIRFTGGTTTTLTGTTPLVAWGASGSLVTLSSTTGGSAWNITSSNASYIWLDWVSLQDSHATGTTAFYAGADSTNVSGNTGWTFANFPIPLGTSAATSAASASITAATLIALDPSGATSTASGTVTTTAQLAATAAAISTASAAITAATQIPLNFSAGLSSAHANVAAPTRVSLTSTGGVSSSQGAVTAATRIVLDPAVSTSTAQGSLTAANILVVGSSSSISSVALELFAATTIALNSSSSISDAVLNLRAVPQITGSSQAVSSTADLVIAFTPHVTGQADAISGDSLVLIAPRMVPLDPSNAVSSAHLTGVYRPGPPGHRLSNALGHVTVTRPGHDTVPGIGKVVTVKSGHTTPSSPGRIG